MGKASETTRSGASAFSRNEDTSGTVSLCIPQTPCAIRFRRVHISSIVFHNPGSFLGTLGSEIPYRLVITLAISTFALRSTVVSSRPSSYPRPTRSQIYHSSVTSICEWAIIAVAISILTASGTPGESAPSALNMGILPELFFFFSLDVLTRGPVARPSGGAGFGVFFVMQ